MRLTCKGGPKAGREIDVRNGMAAFRLPRHGGSYVRARAADFDGEVLVWQEDESLPEALGASAERARTSATPVRTFVAGMKAAAERKGCGGCRKAWEAAQKVVGVPPAPEAAPEAPAASDDGEGA